MNANNSNQRSRGRGTNHRSNQRGRSGSGGGKHSAGNNGGRGGRGGNNQPRNPNQIKQMLDKYLSQAREMTQSGDRVAAEGMFQYAEHYQRLFNEISAAKPQDQNKQNKQNKQNNKPNAVDDQNTKPSENKAPETQAPERKVQKKPVVEVSDQLPQAVIEQLKADLKPAEEKSKDSADNAVTHNAGDAEEKPKPRKRKPRISKTAAAE